MKTSNVMFSVAMRSTAAVALVGAMSGCGSPQGLPEPVDNLNQGIIHGTLVSEAEQRQFGLVTINNSCSGVLLNNSWALTAAHCVNRTAQTTTGVRFTGLTNTSRAVYKFGGANEPDLALVRLSSPYSINGSTSGFNNSLYTGSPLEGLPVTSFGRGRSVYYPASPPLTTNGGWRRATIIVDDVDGETFTMDPNDQGQIPAPGDSGGPDFIFTGSFAIAGIHSKGTWDCVDHSTTDTCKATITEVHSAISVSIPALAAAVNAVRNGTLWSASATSQVLTISSPEVYATRYVIANLDLAPWAYAAKSAYAMCDNRGFAGGHYTGNQLVGQGRYDLHCGGRGAAWFDATAAEVLGSGWPFLDPNTTGWAQTNRAAQQICSQKGFVGGHFNGHMAGSRYGLICYRDGAQWFEAPRGPINSGPYPVGDLNSASWAQAGRAANRYCTQRGFLGGFFNGHQNSSVYGVICQG